MRLGTMGGAPAAAPDDIILAHWTMAEAGFEDRCMAAAAGSFAGIGILPHVYTDCRDRGLTDADLEAMLRSYGVRVAELESLSIAGQQSEADIDAAFGVHWHLAERFGADRVGVVVRPGHPADYQLQPFRRICDEAARRGVRVGIEFIPLVAAFTDITTTLNFVERAGRPNAGLIVDTYHHFRGGGDWAQVEQLPGERVVMVQVSDAELPPVSPDYVTDTMHYRRPPGEGDLPLGRFIRTLDRLGSSAPWSVEVLSDELSALPPADIGRRLGDAMRAVLASSRSSSAR
jgi:sugar phosphate isomerase/epimerase